MYWRYKLIIFQITEYPCNNTYDSLYIFFDIPQIFLEQKLIYHGFSAGKRHVLWRSQHDLWRHYNSLSFSMYC